MALGPTYAYMAHAYEDINDNPSIRFARGARVPFRPLPMFQAHLRWNGYAGAEGTHRGPAKPPA